MKKRSRDAFTLVEVLIAMLILAIGLLGLAGMTVVVLRSNTVAQQITEATNITRSLMEALKREAPRITAACPDINVISVGTACRIVTTSGISELNTSDPVWLPASLTHTGCAVPGILQNDRTFDVTTAQLASQPQPLASFVIMIQRSSADSMFVFIELQMLPEVTSVHCERPCFGSIALESGDESI